MPKVYCKDCLHFFKYNGKFDCTCKNNTDSSGNWLEPITKYKLKPEEKNANNDCQDYISIVQTYYEK